MKQIRILVAVVLLLLGNNSFAKGGGCGGHGGHSGGVVAGIHSGDSSDLFAKLRKKIYKGYVVYRSDTVHGIISYAGNTISIKTSSFQDSVYRYSIKDSNLYAVMLTENNKDLFITRIPGKGYYRLLHSGKMCIYDTYFSFNCQSNEFYQRHPMVVYNGKAKILDGFWTTSVKRKLVSELNKAYGLGLKASDYKKKELLVYVSALK